VFVFEWRLAISEADNRASISTIRSGYNRKLTGRPVRFAVVDIVDNVDIVDIVDKRAAPN